MGADGRALAGEGDEGLAEAVACGYFKLLAYKDEYEVARLHRALEFRRKLEATFEPGLFIPYTVHRGITPQPIDLIMIFRPASQNRNLLAAITSICGTKGWIRHEINELGTLRLASSDPP